MEISYWYSPNINILCLCNTYNFILLIKVHVDVSMIYVNIITSSYNVLIPPIFQPERKETSLIIWWVFVRPPSLKKNLNWARGREVVREQLSTVINGTLHYTVAATSIIISPSACPQQPWKKQGEGWGVWEWEMHDSTGVGHWAFLSWCPWDVGVVILPLSSLSQPLLLSWNTLRSWCPILCLSLATLSESSLQAILSLVESEISGLTLFSPPLPRPPLVSHNSLTWLPAVSGCS